MTLDNTQDIIDSRDVIARIEELELEQGDVDPGCFPDEDQEELTTLKALAAEGADYAPDWQYGEALIRATYFKTYAQELAEDCGMVPEGNNWPCYCIDWDRAARELQIDYTSIDFDGVEYWVRS